MPPIDRRITTVYEYFIMMISMYNELGMSESISSETINRYFMGKDDGNLG